MIETEDQAREVAQRYVSEVLEPRVGQDVWITEIRGFPTCWVVGYNTRLHVETGEIRHALAGGPIIINRESGGLRIGASAFPAEDQLDP